MATREIVTLTDSLDPRISNGVETVTFFHPVFGTKLEIELSEKNREHFANHLNKLSKYIDASRDVTPQPEPVVVRTSSRANDLTAVREWARANGFTVGDRGRIKAEIIQAWETAMVMGPAETPAEQDTETVDETPQDEVESAESNEENAPVEAETLTDEQILAMMAEIEAEGSTVTLENLAEATQQA